MIEHVSSLEKIIAKDELPLLRNEIVESEKARIDFLKYKLMAIASLGSIGLGFSGLNFTESNTQISPDYVLCIIPLVCAYVDLLCYHNTIRILVIAQFLNHYNDPYEGYICKLTDTRYLFNMEDFVLHWSSVIVSFFIMLYSLVPFLNELKTKGIIFLLVGFWTIVLHFLTKTSYKNHQDALFKTAKELKEKEGIQNAN